MIEVITGNMFSGKSTELIRRVRRLRIAGQRVAVYRPEMDTRSPSNTIASHDGVLLNAVEASPARIFEDAARDVMAPQCIAIDEGQFFPIRALVEGLSSRHIDRHLIIACLDKNWRGEPFSDDVAWLLAIADRVDKLSAVCRCGADATMSHRIAGGRALVEVGGADQYEAMCRPCWTRAMNG